jgi:MFS family permease
MVRKSSRTNRTRGALALSMLMTGGLFATFVPVAQADEVSPDGKGIVGGALLGAEVVTVTESLAGVRAGWAYGVFGGVGAVAGGLGGYFVERSSSDGQGAVYLLAGGMALIIPAVVLTLNATRYHPSDSATEDKPPPGIPADPGSPGGSAVTPTPSSPPAGASPPATGVPTSSLAPTSVPVSPSGPTAAPRSLFDLGIAKETSLRFGLPVPEMRPMYSAAEQKTYGLPQHAELRMPVFRLSF